MKTKLLFLFLLFVTFSCEKSTNSPTDSDDQIKSQVKEVVNKIIQGCEEVNSGMVKETSFNSPDFVYLFNGNTLTYQEFFEDLTAFYANLQNQEVTLLDEKFSIPDQSTVLYTTNCTFLQHFNNGDTILIEPMAMLFIFKKIDGNWKWIYGVESYGI